MVGVALWAASCAVPLGPGYDIQKQQIRVDFSPSSAMALRVNAEYTLKNSGTQPIPSLEVRLPRRRFEVSNLSVSWDGAVLAPVPSPENPRNSLVEFHEPWAMTTRHTLHIVFEIAQRAGPQTGWTFAPDAFFLPEGGWSPELVPSRGVAGYGGTPPEKWELTASVPPDFRVHASGEQRHASRKRDSLVVRFQQSSSDLNPFIVAGRYAESSLGHGNRTIHLWTRSAPNSKALADASASLARELDVYDSVFGARKQPAPIWIVECPVASGCVVSSDAPFLEFFGEKFGTSNAEMISFNTAIVNISGASSRIAAIVGPSLAASWLGYGRNPGFYEQKPPLSALPLFAAALGREAVLGPSARVDMIRRALAQIPRRPARQGEEDPRVLRAKSFLFFYALRDRYGADAFGTAVRHMLAARSGVGFDLADFISALEQETHENIAEQVRLWMKHPGVPQEFRDRYGEASAAATFTPEEKPQP